MQLFMQRRGEEPQWLDIYQKWSQNQLIVLGFPIFGLLIDIVGLPNNFPQIPSRDQRVLIYPPEPD